MNDVIEATPGKDSFATPGSGERMILLAFATQDARYIQRRAEEAAIDAEDILIQAEEANAMDPVG